MDNVTANKSHIPCQSWVGQNGWSTTSTREPLLNTPSDSQHLGLGLSSDQGSYFNHLQVLSQSCMNDLSTSSVNNTHQSNLYETSHISSIPSSTMLFSNTAFPSTSKTNSFDQHTSSVLLTANKGKTIAQPSHPQQDQELQPQDLPFLSTHNPYKASFQPPVTNQGLSNRLRDLSTTLPSCGQHLSTSQASFKGANVESAGFVERTRSNASSSSQEQSQWTPSSHSRGAVDGSIPDAAAHRNNEQEGTCTPLGSSERRSALLNQRAQLLKQLEEMDKLLESVPQDDSSDEPSPHPAVQSPSMDDSFLSEQTKASDAQQDQSAEKFFQSQPLLSEDCLSPASYDEEGETSDVPEDQMFSGESEENASAESGDESDSVYGPNSDDDDDATTDFPSDSDGHSSDESSHSSCSTSSEKRPPLSSKKQPKSGNSLHKDKNASPTKQTCVTKTYETVVLPTLNSKESVYKKKNYCLFCSRSLTKMARHLERMHSDKAEVAVAFQYPKKSRERYKIWTKLINEGNFAHNKEVLKTGKGQLAVRKTPKDVAKVTDFVHCLYCRGLYGKKGFFRHVRNCPEKKKSENENEARIGRKSIALKCVLEASGDIKMSDGFKSILCGMIYDDVTQTIMNDKIILQFGEHMFNQYGSDVKKHGYIKQNLRHLGRLVLEAAKTTPLKNLEEFFYLSSFRHVVSAVNVLAGYDSESKTYSIPSLALKLGYHLQKACSIVQDNAVKCGDDSLAESTRRFLSVYQKKWNKLISLGALTTLKETKLITDKNVPFAQDVKSLNFHTENVHLLAEKKLRQAPSAENYTALAKVILARTILFNRRNGQEVSSIQITQFGSRKKSDILDDMDISVSDLERTMCGFFSRVDIRGTSGRMVPVLLKPSFVSAMELLIDVRKTCGVPNENPFLFGRPHALSAYSGTESIQSYVKKCGAKNPKALTLRKMQKHYGTMLQLMNLDEDEAYQILGPNNQVQALRQNSEMQLDDVDMISEGTQNRDKQMQGDKVPQTLSANRYGQMKQAYGVTMDTCGTPHPKSVKFRKHGPQNKDKHKWGEAEVRAVERHMMRFIRGHKVPQKNDCLQCLVAEPDALKTRTWKGVKDYVRNRIITLKRQGSSPKASSANRPQQVKQTHEPRRTKEAHMTAPSKFVKSKEKGPQNKDKHKWGEAEVRAVERHMMRFIRGHKVPQKNDCLQCLAAEPNALKTRTWKGVKDYVRNRIITLKRQGSSPKASSANKPQQVKQTHETRRTKEAHMTAPPKSVKSKEKGPQNKDKHKWGEAEVHAVERHMMRFIRGHKVPQKNDCLQCLAAEPDALKTRTWKGVKDYVRNRITALKRQGGSSWAVFTNGYTSEQVEPRQSTVHFQQQW